jgi:hypothetical protein
MENFEDLQSLWTQQSEAAPKLNSNEIITEYHKKIKAIKREHFWTIGILSTLVLVLSYFHYWIYNSEIAKQVKGLELMGIVIIARIIVEIISVVLFKKVDFTNSFKNYTAQLVSFYKFRRVIHFVLTPIIYILYVYGFISLLPLFKETLSRGFYLYVQFSGIAFLVFFSFLMYKIIKKDLKDLDFLKNIDINK